MLRRTRGNFARVVGTGVLAATIVGSMTAAVVVQSAAPAAAASVCTFNGQASGSLLTNVTPGESITVHCTGLPTTSSMVVAEASLLAAISSDQIAEADVSAAKFVTSSGTGTLDVTYALPDPYSAQDPNSVCPPTQAQINAGLIGCVLAVATFAGVDFGFVDVQSPGQAPPQAPTLALSPTTAEVGQQVKLVNGPGPGQWWGNPDNNQPIPASDITIGGLAPASSTASVAAAKYPVKGGKFGPLVPPAIGGGFIVPCGASGSETVSVTEPNTQVIPGTISATATLQVIPGKTPAVSGRRPARGPAAGGTMVTVQGCNFTKVSAVTFGTTAATSFTVNSPTSITAEAPAGTGTVNVVVTGKKGSSTTSVATQFTYGLQGYDMVGSDGTVYPFGDGQSFGSEGGKHLAKPIVGMAATPDGKGYWLVGSDGGIFSFGDAPFEGSLPGEHITPAKPIVGITASSDGKGYLLVGADGGVFRFGDAPFEGSLPGEHITPAKPIVGIAATPDGKGYRLVGADGGVFGFGDAPFEGSLPGKHITPAKPVVGMAETSDGAGYWLVGADGGVFGLGDAKFAGSLPSRHIVPAKPIVGIASTDDAGYYLVGSDGGVFSMGDEVFKGSEGGKTLPGPIVGCIPA